MNKQQESRDSLFSMKCICIHTQNLLAARRDVGLVVLTSRRRAGWVQVNGLCAGLKSADRSWQQSSSTGRQVAHRTVNNEQRGKGSLDPDICWLQTKEIRPVAPGGWNAVRMTADGLRGSGQPDYKDNVASCIRQPASLICLLWEKWDLNPVPSSTISITSIVERYI